MIVTEMAKLEDAVISTGVNECKSQVLKRGFFQ